MNSNELNSVISCFCTQSNNCQDCNELFKMPFSYCCLRECHKHEFCKGCNNGIYSKNFKDWIKIYNE